MVIENYINNPEGARENFDLAIYYYTQKHYAGAISHFIRCAEYGDNKELTYQSLLYTALSFRILGNRPFTERNWLLQAICHSPDRPEAYWMMSQYYERMKNWPECYAMACLGLEHIGKGKWLDYADYKLLFQKAVSAWWIGRTTESRQIFFSLPDYPLSDDYVGYVQNNLSKLGSGRDPFLPYTKDKAERLRYKFKGYDKIERNFSQTYQDMFVLSMMDGNPGYYLEIGSADPFYGSNTALLEQFGWDGISIEIKEDDVKKFKDKRKNTVICRDATTINYSAFLKGVDAPKVIDYLQVDCEPPKTTYEILLAIPFEEYKFRVITFEHDYYADASRSIRDKSRKFLLEQGYELAVTNIAPNEISSFEDWWVHPDLVDANILDRMRSVDDQVKNAERYMTNE